MPSADQPYAELIARTAFSFHEGASSPEELVDRAVELELAALAVTDRDGVYAIPRAHKHARGRLPLICGALVTLDGLPGLALLARDEGGWRNLCHVLTRSRAGPMQTPPPPDAEAAALPRAPEDTDAVKGRGSVDLDFVLARAAGLEAVLVGEWAPTAAGRVKDAFGAYASLAYSRRLDSQDEARLAAARSTAREAGLPLVATTDALMHHPDRKRLQDVLTCVRLRCTLDQAGRALQPNAARCLTAPGVMERLLRGLEPALPAAERRASLARTVEVASRCRFSLDSLAYLYPREVVPEGQTPMAWLRRLTDEGLRWRYPSGVPTAVARQVQHELGLIEKMDFPAYFLTVHDAVRFAMERGILCQGRGSAANSAVCYALGVTAVDPATSSLLFERFISEERGEPPDIDVDFEHERREEVIPSIYEKYGRHRAAMVCTVTSYRRRSAIRDVGKALGLSLDQVDRLARRAVWAPRHRDAAGGEAADDDAPALALDEDEAKAAGVDPRDPRVHHTLALAEELRGLPRHLGIHVGGFTISDGPLVDLVPVEPASMEGRTVLQWDKDDIDIVRFVKVDVLALGILTAIRKGFDLIRAAPQLWPRHPRGDLDTLLTLAGPPRDDRAVYDMIGRADTMGVFQIESRAQMSMLPRLKPRNYYDLVIEISLVRPGPIQGGMVHPYLRRRTGEEDITYAHPLLEPILARTLGVPIFQEQVMAMAVAVGGFSPGQADELRRAMGAWRKRGTLDQLTATLLANMEKNGITREFAEQICKQIEGFGEYGFPESHAASFARLVWVSAWLRAHYPAAFTAALLNAQPMGFYAPRTLVGDAQRRGVEVRPVDVQRSEWDCSLEPGAAPPAPPNAPLPDGRGGPALRLGMRQVRGLHEASGHAIADARRAGGPFRDAADLLRRSGVRRDELARLARADALRDLGPDRAPPTEPPQPAPPAQAPPATWDRRQALWAVQGLYDLPLFRGIARDEAPAPLPAASPVEELEADYHAVGLSVDKHPIGLVREALNRRDILPATKLRDVTTGQIVKVAGVVTHRQRPGTANGMVFMTLEDETGLVNLAIRPNVFERQRALICGETLLEVRGRLQREGDAVSVLALRFGKIPYGPLMRKSSRDFR